MDTSESNKIQALVEAGKERPGGVADAIKLHEMAMRRIAVVPVQFSTRTISVASTNAFAR
jgi:hypothetical protein